MHSAVWNWIFIHQALFLITGILSTICAQIVTYHGGAHPQSLMLSWPSYLGMLIVGLLPVKGPGSSGGNTSRKHILLCAATNVIANICCMAGLQIIGSGIYQVLYSSVIVFTALLSRTFLGKSPSQLQWIAIFSIAAGLGMTSHDSAPVSSLWLPVASFHPCGIFLPQPLLSATWCFTLGRLTHRPPTGGRQVHHDGGGHSDHHGRLHGLCQLLRTR